MPPPFLVAMRHAVPAWLLLPTTGVEGEAVGKDTLTDGRAVREPVLEAVLVPDAWCAALSCSQPDRSTATTDNTINLRIAHDRTEAARRSTPALLLAPPCLALIQARPIRLESASVLAVGLVVLAVLVTALLTVWVTFTLTRLDRLHARVDAAQAALDAQLVRRAAALSHVAESPDSGAAEHRRAYYETVARAALSVDDAERHDAENAVGRALTELVLDRCSLQADSLAELQEAATRVVISRRFYNDAVRDTRALRSRRMPRLLHLAGRRGMPLFFDIDDTLRVPDVIPAASTSDRVAPHPDLVSPPAKDTQ